MDAKGSPAKAWTGHFIRSFMKLNVLIGFVSPFVACASVFLLLKSVHNLSSLIPLIQPNTQKHTKSHRQDPIHPRP